jgi:hypothetical protein
MYKLVFLTPVQNSYFKLTFWLGDRGIWVVAARPTTGHLEVEIQEKMGKTQFSHFL